MNREIHLHPQSPRHPPPSRARAGVSSYGACLGDLKLVIFILFNKKDLKNKKGMKIAGNLGNRRGVGFFPLPPHLSRWKWEWASGGGGVLALPLTLGLL